MKTVERPLSEGQLRSICLRLLHSLDILPPFTPEALCQRLGRVRGRRIKLVADELYTTSSVGHLIAKAHRDLIAYQQRAPRAQQDHVIYHEVMHLVLGHLDDAGSLTCGMLEEAAVDTGPGLYARWQEWEAETGATILSELSRQRAHPELVTRAAPPADRGIAAAFGIAEGHWR